MKSGFPAIVSLLLAKRVSPIAFGVDKLPRVGCINGTFSWLLPANARWADIYQNLSIAEFVICSCHLFAPNAINAVNCISLTSSAPSAI